MAEPVGEMAEPVGEMAEPATGPADDLAAGPAPFVHRLRVRYSECDPQGVVFNPQYLAFADHALTEMWRERFGGYVEMLEQGVDVVVAEATVRFRASARFDEELDISVSVAHLGTTSMTLHDTITRAADGTPIAEVELRYVWVDRATGGKTAVPDWARAKLAP